MTDPRDRRRSLIRESPQVSDRVSEVRAAPVDDAVAAALDTDDRQDIAETVALLEELARRLIPRTLSH